MITYGYLTVGIIYLILAIVYIVYTVLFFRKYRDEKYDQFIAFSKIRYSIFAGLYIIIAGIYILSDSHVMGH